MFLYRIEVEMTDKTGYLIILAKDDEEAFDYVESMIVRHYVHRPTIQSSTIVEKKRVAAGAGYFIEAELE